MALAALETLARRHIGSPARRQGFDRPLAIERR